MKVIFWFTGCLAVFVLYLNWFETWSEKRSVGCWAPPDPKGSLFYTAAFCTHHNPVGLRHCFLHHRKHCAHLYDLVENRGSAGIGLSYSKAHQLSEFTTRWKSRPCIQEEAELRTHWTHRCVGQTMDVGRHHSWNGCLDLEQAWPKSSQSVDIYEVWHKDFAVGTMSVLKM